MHSGIYAWFPENASFNPLVYTSKAKHNRFCHTVRTHGGLKGLKTVYYTDNNGFFIDWDFNNSDWDF
jgi:hypothetical protein